VLPQEKLFDTKFCTTTVHILTAHAKLHKKGKSRPNCNSRPSMSPYQVVEKTHLTRLHYRCISTTTHFTRHAGFMIFCLTLLGTCILYFAPLDSVSQLFTAIRTILAPSTSFLNLNSRCLSLHLSHQLFIPFSISSVSHMQLRSVSIGFSLHNHYYMVRELPTLLQRVKYSCIYGTAQM